MKNQPIPADLADMLRAYEVNGSLADAARAAGVSRSTAYNRLKKIGRLKRPIASGTKEGKKERRLAFPKRGQVKRYILTSAQNNTHIHKPVWENLLALAAHYKAEILVGTYSYNQNHYGPLSVKLNKSKAHEHELWYDDALKPYINDDRLELGHGLVWCGEMNIQPTAEDPLQGLETYSQRKSAVFPHAKMAMRSIATMKGEGTKLNYTTGTVTLKNYIQKKAGLKGEHHHIYGAVLVEVDSAGSWWVRQLVGSSDGTICDLDLIVSDGKVTTRNRVEAITWGDIHSTIADKAVVDASLVMLDSLKPHYQFMHDILEGASISHHIADDCHEKFRTYVRGLNQVHEELRLTADLLLRYDREFSQMVVVDSNHDGSWLARWLRENDYRRDPSNALIFLELQTAVYKAIATKMKGFNLLAYAMLRFDDPDQSWVSGTVFLNTDQSFKICGGKIECGMHGHLGPNGARGTPRNLNKVGRRANTAHTHSAGIYNGLYVAGTSSNLDMGYNKGPSSWTHSHIITYFNGTRSIVTLWDGKWKA